MNELQIKEVVSDGTGWWKARGAKPRLPKKVERKNPEKKNPENN